VFTVILCTDKCLQWHCVQTSVYSDTVYRQVFTPYCSNRSDKVSIELHIDSSTPTPTAPTTTILSYQSRNKEYYI